MVTKQLIRKLARKYDTQMAAAFLKAIGDTPMSKRYHKRHYKKRERAKYKHLLWCFKNTHSPMDWH